MKGTLAEVVGNTRLSRSFQPFAEINKGCASQHFEKAAIVGLSLHIFLFFHLLIKKKNYNNPR